MKKKLAMNGQYLISPEWIWTHHRRLCQDIGPRILGTKGEAGIFWEGRTVTPGGHTSASYHTYLEHLNQLLIMIWLQSKAGGKAKPYAFVGGLPAILR